jgi:hypothetical protein
MSIMSILDEAQGGQLFRKLGGIAGASPSEARTAIEAFCPTIAARLKTKAEDRGAFDELLALLDDNDGDLLTSGDLASRDAMEDGEAVLEQAYGSLEAAREEAAASARALRLDRSAAERLHPIAAALVLALLSRRFAQETPETSGFEEEGDQGRSSNSESGQRTGFFQIVFAAIGGAILRSLISRFRPRRRRRARYSVSRYASRRSGRSRRTRRREPGLEDLFRELLR